MINKYVTINIFKLEFMLDEMSDGIGTKFTGQRIG